MEAPQRTSSKPKLERKPYVFLKDRMAKFNPILDLIYFVWGVVSALRF